MISLILLGGLAESITETERKREYKKLIIEHEKEWDIGAVEKPEAYIGKKKEARKEADKSEAEVLEARYREISTRRDVLKQESDDAMTEAKKANETMR